MSNSKKILFVANVAKEHINKFHIPTINCFKENGWEVHVACSGDARIPGCDKQYDMCWKRSPFTYKTLKGVWDLKKIIHSEKYDIIYCHTPVGGLVARLAAKPSRKYGTKVVYCAHGLHFYKGAPLINWLLYYPLEKIMAKFTDCFITINKEDYDRVRNNFNKKLEVRLIPGIGVNFERLKIKNINEVRKKYRESFGVTDNTTVLIYVAELLKNKNQQMLINTLKFLIDRGEDVFLVLPGPDHANGKLQKYAEKMGVNDYVKFLGWRSDIGELLYASDICVASSIREGFGINLVEAMYCNLPVVAVVNRGHKMIINDGENGFLVELGDFKKMGDKIELLIHDDSMKAKMSNLDVSKYDCNVVAKNIYEIISKMRFL